MNDPGAQQPGQQQSYTTIETYTAKHDIVNRLNEYFINIEGREGGGGGVANPSSQPNFLPKSQLPNLKSHY